MRLMSVPCLLVAAARITATLHSFCVTKATGILVRRVLVMVTMPSQGCWISPVVLFATSGRRSHVRRKFVPVHASMLLVPLPDPVHTILHPSNAAPRSTARRCIALHAGASLPVRADAG